MNKERFFVISKNDEFFNLFDSTGFEINKHIPERYDINLVKTKIKGYGPSIIAIDSLLDDIDNENFQQLQKLSLNELILYVENRKNIPLFVKVLRDLHLFRVKNNWPRCLLLVMIENPDIQLIHGLRQLGADRVVGKRLPSNEELSNAICRIRKLIPQKSDKKRLNVLVAENHIDSFLLLESILLDFCDLKLAVENKNGSMRDVAELSSIRIVNEYYEGYYDAIIMDLALSIKLEYEAKNISERIIVGERSFNSLSAEAHVVGHLDGLVATRRLREESGNIPICILSNYVSQQKFVNIIKRCWGPDVFNSIAIFEKDYRGRQKMKNWLKRLY